MVEDPGANALGGADEGTFVDAINPNAPNIKVGACSQMLIEAYLLTELSRLLQGSRRC